MKSILKSNLDEAAKLQLEIERVELGKLLTQYCYPTVWQPEELKHWWSIWIRK